MKKKNVLIIGFLVALWLPILQMNLQFYREFDNLENRELAKAPDLNPSRFKRWPAECDAYLSDHFGLRPDLIRWNNVLRVILLGVSPVESVILGKDSWLFYRSETLEDGDTINDYTGAIPLSGEDLAELEQILEENHREFSKNGIFYLVVIAPNKNTIYGENLPDEIEGFKAKTRLDQFMAHMKIHSDVEILDLREPLLQAKESQPVYMKTDSHWNTYGAYVGYRKIMDSLATRFPERCLEPAQIAGDKVTLERTLPGGDLAQMLFMQDLLPEDHHTQFNLSGTPKTPLFKTLLFRHDSFGDNLYPFLTPLFQKIVNIAPFVPFDFETIRKHDPEIVLHVFVERYLPQAVSGDFFFRSPRSRAESP
ncbi:MAG: hypothetical protein GX443_15080 [Deltaproteobacteria bacterium]|nr:hypothetical protein [Deltaproteobacteria bacterium]